MIYFDNNKATLPAPKILNAESFLLDNPDGHYSASKLSDLEIKTAIEKARSQLAQLIGAKSPNEIIFTSGGTESNILAIGKTIESTPQKKHIITTCAEHKSIRNLCTKLERTGCEVTLLAVDEEGLLDLNELKSALRKDTTLVSIMMANNETGVLFPTAEISEIIKTNSNALFHVDGAVAVGKIPVDLKNTEIDFLSVSGRKFHAPQGIGALYVRKNINSAQIFANSFQENVHFSETENLHNIIGLGRAAEIAEDFSAMKRIEKLCDKLEHFILQNIPNTKLNGTIDNTKRLPNTSNISFSNTNGEVILAKLCDLGILVSTASACNSENHTASAVLQAMNVPYADAMGAICFSLGRYNTEDEVDFVIEKLPKVIEEARKLSF